MQRALVNELMKIKNVTNYDETDDDLRFIIMKIYDKKLISTIVSYIVSD